MLCAADTIVHSFAIQKRALTLKLKVVSSECGGKNCINMKRKQL
jgi:hypothetical protein